MLISELVKKLVAFQTMHGDINVVVLISAGEIDCPEPEYNTDENEPVIVIDAS